MRLPPVDRRRQAPADVAAHAVGRALARRTRRHTPGGNRPWHTGDPADPDRRRRPGRPEQKLPGRLTPGGVEWAVFLACAGRGWGKTRTGAEATIDLVISGEWRRPALLAPTAADARDTMVLGPAGLLACSPPDFMPVYHPGQRRVTWPNGAEATLYSGERPDRLRGPGHDGAWVDELAAIRYVDAWDQLQFVLREGENPRIVATTTPRPTKLIRALLASPSTYVVRGTSYENLGNLAASYRARVIEPYEGTRLGRQEIHAELLDELEGAYWTLAVIEAQRVSHPPQDADGRLALSRVVVTIDPAGRTGAENDQTGIAVAGRGFDGHLYLLHAEGVRLSPRGWATRALDLYDLYEADTLIAERNNGGDMVEATIRSVRESAPVETIHASRGKVVRAEPVAALYEQGKVSHVGYLREAEDQLTSFPVDPDAGDDVVDAIVYALTALTETPERPLGGIVAVGGARGWSPGQPRRAG